MTDADDPIAFELFRNAIFSIADEMALTIFRTTYSGVLKDNMDYSTAFCDAEGKLVAQGLTLPGHLGAIPTALEVLVARYRDDMGQGDVFAMNDPFEGGMHLPDIFVFKPLYFEGERIAFAATICHHTDVGGRVAGSNASDSTEIYQEGLRIPPLKLYEAGRPNTTLFALIEKNVRVPVKVFGDLRAQLAACHIAERQFLELAARHGAALTRRYMADVIDHAERMTRSALQDLPDGQWSFEDWIDDDGVDVDRPIRLFVTMTKQGDHMLVDWTGTDPQVKGAINNTLSFTKAASYTAIRSVLPADIPNNEGVFRAIEVKAPPGTIANGVLPAACAARGLTGFRMVDCAFGCLAMMLPDKVFAASDGGNTGISIGGYHADRSPFIYVDFTCGAWGGRPWADGLDGNSNMFANMASHSVEVTEAEQPIRIEAYEFVPDKAGPGKFRGGVPFRRDYRFLEEEGILQVRSDRHTIPPYGLYGGQPGRPSQNHLNPETENRPLPSKLTMTITKGQVFRHEVAGAGGYGDPLERDPAAVARDVQNEVVSRAAAGADYGVVLDDEGRVEAQATARLRAEHRRARALDGDAGRDPQLRPIIMGRGMRFRVGVDIGGTFTDIVLLAEDGSTRTRKVSSSVDDYARAIAEGLARLFEELGIEGDDIEEIRHGTTVASNAILEHKGARTGLITTKGFRDVLEIRNLRMPRMYDIAWTKPPPLVPRHLRVPVDERIGARGEVVRPLDPAEAERAVRRLLDQGVAGAGGLPSQLLRQSGPRADDQGGSASAGAGSADLDQLRGAARDQGVRAHLEHRDQRLSDADRRPLPGAGSRATCRPGACGRRS